MKTSKSESYGFDIAPPSASAGIVVLLDNEAVWQAAAIFRPRLFCVGSRFERAADEFAAAAETAFGIVAADVAPHKDTEFSHLSDLPR
jgi:hypothetical protein